MSDDHRLAGPSYSASEPEDAGRSKSWDYAVLGILVVVTVVLVTAGAVPFFGF